MTALPGSRAQVGTSDSSADNLDAKSVWIRFIADKSNGGTVLQLHRFRFIANTKSNKSSVDSSADIELVGKTIFWELVSGDGGYPEDFQYELPQDKPGNRTYDLTLNWKDNSGAAKTSVLRCTYFVPDLYREDYGWRLDANGVDHIAVDFPNSHHGMWDDPDKTKKFRKAVLSYCKKYMSEK